MGSFSDICGEWANESEARLRAVFARSVELLADELTTTRANGGKLPHKTGNLMRSLLASTAGLPAQGGSEDRYSGQDVGLVAAGLSLGDTVWLGYQANYARRMNYGFKGTDALGRSYDQEGAHFVEYAIEMWPILVELAAGEIKNSVEGRG